MFREAAAQMAARGRSEWAPDKYTFVCITYEEIHADLERTAADALCDVGLGGVEDTVEWRDAGIRFSHPTYKGGDLLLIYAPPKDFLWTWTQPFSWTVWVAFFGSSIVVAIVVFFLDVPVKTMRERPREAFNKFQMLSWSSIGMLLQANFRDFTAHSIGSRLTVIAYAIVVLVIVATYIAVFTAQLTVTSFEMNIHGIADVINRPVGVFEAETHSLSKYSLTQMVPFPWASLEDEKAMISALKEKKIAALLIDGPFASYTAAQDCSLHIAGSFVRTINFAFAFDNKTDFTYIDYFNTALAVLQDDGTEEFLWKKYMDVDGKCSSSSIDLANAQITFEQLGGLWILLGSAMGLGLVVNIIMYITGKFTKQGEVQPESSGQSFAPGIDVLGGSTYTTEEEAIESLQHRVVHMDKKMKIMNAVMSVAMMKIEQVLAEQGHMRNDLQTHFGLTPQSKTQAQESRRASVRFNGSAPPSPSPLKGQLGSRPSTELPGTVSPTRTLSVNNAPEQLVQPAGKPPLPLAPVALQAKLRDSAVDRAEGQHAQPPAGNSDQQLLRPGAGGPTTLPPIASVTRQQASLEGQDDSTQQPSRPVKDDDSAYAEKQPPTP